MRVALIGPLPPPHGGVSVYLDRLRRKLLGDGHRVRVIDPVHTSWPGRAARALLLAAERPDRVELHFASRRWFQFLLATGLAGRTVYVDHRNLDLEAAPAGLRRVLRRFLARVREVRLTGPELAASYRAAGLDLEPSRLAVAPAWLAPARGDEERILAGLPAAALDFARAHRPLLVATAFAPAEHRGQDLYGLDLCAELVGRLAGDRPRLGLLLALATAADNDVWRAFRRRLEERGVAAAVHVLVGAGEVWPLFRLGDLLVRPTRADSFGVSVAEALALGCQAVASDVCQRPAGTVLFRSGDVADLEAKCRRALAGSSRPVPAADGGGGAGR